MSFKSAPTAPKKPQSTGRPHQVRIIGGQWKRTPLPVLSADGLRPTPDRVRETVFNWINHLFDGFWAQRDCLDMFAGSGALGFEAASRGARRVCLWENHTPAFVQLQANKAKLKAEQIELLRCDAMAQSRRMPAASFDLIFIDPPYQSQLSAQALQLAAGLLKKGGLIYLELPREQELPAWLDDWLIVRQDCAGMIAFFLLSQQIEAKGISKNRSEPD